MRLDNSFHVTISNYPIPDIRSKNIVGFCLKRLLFLYQMRLLLIWAMYWDGYLISSSQYPKIQRNCFYKSTYDSIYVHLSMPLVILNPISKQECTFFKGSLRGFHMIDREQYFIYWDGNDFSQHFLARNINSVTLLSPFSRAHWGVSIIAVSSSPQTGNCVFNDLFVNVVDLVFVIIVFVDDVFVVIVFVVVFFVFAFVVCSLLSLSLMSKTMTISNS